MGLVPATPGPRLGRAPYVRRVPIANRWSRQLGLDTSYQGSRSPSRVRRQHAIGRVRQGERGGLELSFHGAR